MRDENTEARKIVVEIRRLLLNYDLILLTATCEIKNRVADMNLLEHRQDKKSQKLYVKAKVEKERYELYVDEINNLKNELLENLELILDKYCGKYKNVFVVYFIEGKSREETAELTNYSVDAVKKIVERFRHDLIDLFIVDNQTETAV